MSYYHADQHFEEMQSQSTLSEAQRAQNEVATSLPSADPRDTGGK